MPPQSIKETNSMVLFLRFAYVPILNLFNDLQIQREPFDYTKLRQDMDVGLSIEEISKRAMTLRMKNT